MFAAGVGVGAWWEPARGVAVVGSLGFWYVLWRLRFPSGAFAPPWQADAAERAGWSPRVGRALMPVVFVLSFGSVVVSWLT